MPNRQDCERRQHNRSAVTPIEFRAPERHCFIETKCGSPFNSFAPSEEPLHDNSCGSGGQEEIPCIAVNMLINRNGKWIQAFAFAPTDLFKVDVEKGEVNITNTNSLVRYLVLTAEFSIDKKLTDDD